MLGSDWLTAFVWHLDSSSHACLLRSRHGCIEKIRYCKANGCLVSLERVISRTKQPKSNRKYENEHANFELGEDTRRQHLVVYPPGWHLPTAKSNSAEPEVDLRFIVLANCHPFFPPTTPSLPACRQKSLSPPTHTLFLLPRPSASTGKVPRSSCRPHRTSPALRAKRLTGMGSCWYTLA